MNALLRWFTPLYSQENAPAAVSAVLAIEIFCCPAWELLASVRQRTGLAGLGPQMIISPPRSPLFELQEHMATSEFRALTLATPDKRHLRGGFAVGEIALEGIDAHAGSRAQVVFQNEFLSFERGGVIEVSVPDLIVILDVDTGHAITTEVLRYGQRVAVVALPCHPLLRTPEALAVVGPQAFGLDGVVFRPLARRAG